MNTSEICRGNFEQKYLQLPNIHNNVMKNHSSELNILYNYVAVFIYCIRGTETVAIVDSTCTGTFSIFHVDCEVLVDGGSELKKCLACKKHKKSLSSMACRPQKDEHTHHNVHQFTHS